MSDLVVAYDRVWHARFEKAVRIKDALGSTVVEIKHVGSTAVP